VCAAHRRGAVRFDQLRALDANHEERQQPVPARLARARARRGEGRGRANVEVPSLTCRAAMQPPRGAALLPLGPRACWVDWELFCARFSRAATL